MYNNVYQDYINTMLGRTSIETFNFDNINNQNKRNSYYRFPSNNNSQNDLTKLYPEIYKLLNPMIQSACMRYTSPLTKEALDKMVDDIYNNFTTEDSTIININLTNYPTSDNNDTKDSIHTSTNNNTTSKSMPNKSVLKSNNNNTTNNTNNTGNNNILKDLIRILIIKELILRQGNAHSAGEVKYGSEQFGIYEDPAKMYSNFDQGYNIFGF